jgi:DNA-directed RNA polymerase specialized sigma24 family protein
MMENNLESTNKLLKVIISLLIRERIENMPTLREQIQILNGLGLHPREIADILGKNNKYINKELSDLRKPRRKK